MVQTIKGSSVRVKGVYLFSGEDEFRKTAALNKLKCTLLGPEKGPFNYEVFDAKDSNLEEVLRSLATPPFSGKKLIVLQQPELLSDEQKESLTSYLTRHNSGHAAVLVLSSSKLPMPNDAFSQALLEHAQVVSFTRLKPKEVSSWIAQEFRRRNKAVNAGIVESIRQISQDDLGRADAFIEQISVFVGERERINENDVSLFSETPSESSTFELLDSIHQRDKAHSLKALEILLRTNSNPQQIIGAINWYLTRLIAAKRLLLKRTPRSQIASYFGIDAYRLDKLIAQAQEIGLGKLRSYQNTLLDTDLMLKRTGIKGSILLELLVVRISA